MRRIFTVGETTYDIIFRDGQPAGAIVGGSVLNTSVTLGRLSMPVLFISRMGNDHIGELSLQFLIDNGVNCDYITRYEGNSRLALAFLDEQNNAEYQFYKAEKSPSLRFPELNVGDIVTFGSTNALRDEGRNSLLLFLNQAHDKDVLTIYDPNIREFSSLELIDIRRKFEENLYMTKVLKGSNQDFMRLYNTNDIDEIFEKVSAYGVGVLIMTRGDAPILLKTSSLILKIPFEPLTVVSTIGAGDNFTAGLVYGFIINSVDSVSIRDLDQKKWLEIISYAIKFSGYVCQSESNYISNEFAEKFKLML